MMIRRTPLRRRDPIASALDGYWASYGFHHRYWDEYYHENSPEQIVIEGYEPDGQTDLAIDKLRAAAAAEKTIRALLVTWHAA